MRILNSLKLHSNNAKDGLILELVDEGSKEGGCYFRFGIGDHWHRIDAATANTIMEMSERTGKDPKPVYKP